MAINNQEVVQALATLTGAIQRGAGGQPLQLVSQQQQQPIVSPPHPTLAGSVVSSSQLFGSEPPRRAPPNR